MCAQFRTSQQNNNEKPALDSAMENDYIDTKGWVVINLASISGGLAQPPLKLVWMGNIIHNYPRPNHVSKRSSKKPFGEPIN